VSNCVGFQAIIKATTHFSKGLRYTGVVGAICGRSEMVLPNGIGDLQKGERLVMSYLCWSTLTNALRYCNMDFVFGSVLKSFEGITECIVSYDIACQWFVNLHNRIDRGWPEDLKPAKNLSITPAIPAFHHPGHGQKKHEEYDPKLVRGNGISDNEGPERLWGPHNVLGNSTKNMGPESRHFVLDNFSFWNWTKYANHGT